MTTCTDSGSSEPKPPLSDRLCDAACVAFALWTICFHAVVAAGGGLRILIGVYTVVSSALGAALFYRIRRGRTEGASLPRPGARSSRSGALRYAQTLGFVAGGIAVIQYARSGDPVILWWSIAALLGAAAVALIVSEAPDTSPPARGRLPEIALWILAASCAVLLLFVNRPDADDSFYVNVAVAAVDDPDRALLRADTLHGIEGLPLHLPAHRLHSFEALNAALSYLTGISPIVCFHWIAATLAALFIPLAHAKLFRLLTPRLWPWAVAVLIVVLIAAGETYRWYGNYAFLRIWQGKSIYLSVFMPLVYAYALRFALRPTPRAWLLLATAQIAALGCSASAVGAAPAGALAALCCALRPTRGGLRTFTLGALASLYVLCVGWLLKSPLQAILQSALDEVHEPGSQLLAAFTEVLGTSHLQTFAIASVLLAWTCCTGLARRFAIVVPLAVSVVLLNPYADEWVRSNLTGPAYWHSLWSLPVPILMALVLIAPLQLAGHARSRAIPGAASLLLVIAFATLVPSYSGLSTRNNVILESRPALKVHPSGYSWAAAVNRIVPPRSFVVAPRKVSLYLPTFPNHPYPLMVRHYLDLQRGRIGKRNVETRYLMTRYVAGEVPNEAAHARFRNGLQQFDVRGVCLRLSDHAPRAREILRAAGFHRELEGLSHEIWVRP